MSVDTASSNAGNVALIVSGTSGIGVVTVVNEYAVLIGLALSVISIIIAVIFHIRADRWRRKIYLEEVKRSVIEESNRRRVRR